MTDDQAILISDIFPTADFGAGMANIKHGHTVAVFGCGPFGRFAIDATSIIRQREGTASVIDAYKAFDKRLPGWLKVALTESREGRAG